MMPEMTGPELVREATARWPSTAILYVTGYVGEAGSEELSGHDILQEAVHRRRARRRRRRSARPAA